MAEPIQVGIHWATVETKAVGAGWKGIWAVYADADAARQGQVTDDARALVSGSTAMFATLDEAHARAMLDADRSAAVISGTYRD